MPRSILVLFTLALALAGCGDPPPAKTAGTDAPPPASRRAADWPSEDRAWGKFHSKRFQLAVPLPDGKSWKIDDHSRPWLFAVHDATQSKLWLASTHEDELMNRQKCEARARELGWVPAAQLTTVEDKVTVGPEAYDTRVWIAIEAGKPGGEIEGHVFLFGAFVRKCLLVHLATKVAGAAEEDVLSSRLAAASARVVRGITIDPPRTSDDAEVPRDKPEIRR
jgi:hypothetical protein